MAKNKKKINYQGISTLEVLEGANNYNRWIAEELLAYSRGDILEIGSGIGNISLHFKSKKISVSDVDRGLVRHLANKFKRNKNVNVINLDITKKPSLKFISKYNTVFAVNVMEHINDDLSALKNVYRLLSPGGSVLLLVPANKFAYSKLDKSLGHYRRYEKSELIEKLRDAGFDLKKLYYFNVVGLLSWMIRDKVSKNNINLKPYQIAVFDALVPILKFFESVARPPIGISLIVIAKKIK